MSTPVGVLYHWSPAPARPQITKRGLRPTCPTADGEDTVLAVCLGTSPSHAWSLSGSVFSEPGEDWDLWQVTLDDGDEVRPMPFFGHRLAEFRVSNRIPKSRCWLVGTRTVAVRRWSVA